MGGLGGLRGLFVVALVGASAVVVPPVQADVEPPNIVMIVTDDQDLSSLAYMPRLQELLVEQGMTFTDAIFNLPLCCPTRASILRGQNARNTGVQSNTAPQGGFAKFHNSGAEADTLPVWLRAAGYDTAFIGKYLNGYPTDVSGLGLRYVPPGWDRWVGLYGNVQSAVNYSLNTDGKLSSGGEYVTDRLSREATDYIATQDSPFFLAAFVTAPHSPLEPAPRHAGLHPGLTAPRPPNFNEATMYDKTFYRSRPKLSATAVASLDRDYRLRVLELQAVDEMIEAVVTALAAEGILEHTYVVFTTDNGWNLGEHRLTGKPYPYEENIRMPLVIRGPGITPGSSTEELVGDVDFAPTFADLAGASVPDFVDGRSFAHLLSAGHETPARWRDAYYLPSGVWHGIRTTDSAYIEFNSGGREYYDLNADPWQLDNIYNTLDRGFRTALHQQIESFKGCHGATCRAVEEQAAEPRA